MKILFLILFIFSSSVFACEVGDTSCGYWGDDNGSCTSTGGGYYPCTCTPTYSWYVCLNPGEVEESSYSDEFDFTCPSEAGPNTLVPGAPVLYCMVEDKGGAGVTVHRIGTLRWMSGDCPGSEYDQCPDPCSEGYVWSDSSESCESTCSAGSPVQRLSFYEAQITQDSFSFDYPYANLYESDGSKQKEFCYQGCTYLYSALEEHNDPKVSMPLGCSYTYSSNHTITCPSGTSSNNETYSFNIPMIPRGKNCVEGENPPAESTSEEDNDSPIYPTSNLISGNQFCQQNPDICDVNIFCEIHSTQDPNTGECVCDDGYARPNSESPCELIGGGENPVSADSNNDGTVDNKDVVNAVNQTSSAVVNEISDASSDITQSINNQTGSLVSTLEQARQQIQAESDQQTKNTADLTNQLLSTDDLGDLPNSSDLVDEETFNLFEGLLDILPEPPVLTHCNIGDVSVVFNVHSLGSYIIPIPLSKICIIIIIVKMSLYLSVVLHSFSIFYRTSVISLSFLG